MVFGMNDRSVMEMACLEEGICIRKLSIVFRGEGGVRGDEEQGIGKVNACAPLIHMVTISML